MNWTAILLSLAAPACGLVGWFVAVTLTRHRDQNTHTDDFTANVVADNTSYREGWPKLMARMDALEHETGRLRSRVLQQDRQIAANQKDLLAARRQSAADRVFTSSLYALMDGLIAVIKANFPEIATDPRVAVWLFMPAAPPWLTEMPNPGKVGEQLAEAAPVKPARSAAPRAPTPAKPVQALTRRRQAIAEAALADPAPAPRPTSRRLKHQ